MRVEVVDPSGGGLALAIGLAQLGHEVAHRGPTSWAAAAPGSPARCSRELQQRFLRPAHDGDAPADLLVIVDVFADLLHQLQSGSGCRPDDPDRDPLRDDASVLAYPRRLAFYLERAAAAPAVAVVDMADRRDERESAFAGLPQATLFARECAAHGDGPWRPFPFLFNQVMLWLELLRPRDEWWIAPAARRPRVDWAFCGSLDHPRYGGRRRVMLDELARRWPGSRGEVMSTAPFLDVLRTLQSARFGVDLPGAGELCFRLHECLALGVPVVRPFAGDQAVPRGLADVLAADPAALRVWQPDAVAAFAAAHYCPRAAASWLLAGVGAGAASG